MYGEMDSKRRNRIVLLTGAAVLMLTATVMSVVGSVLGGLPVTDSLRIADGVSWPVVPTGHGWDLLVAPLWAMFLARYVLDTRRDVYTSLAAASGLTFGLSLYLFGSGEPTLLTLIVSPIAAIVCGRVANLLDDAGHRRNRSRAEPFGIGAALYYCLAFGLGMLVPFAVQHGLLLAVMIPFVGFMMASFLLCTGLFSILGVLRLAAGLYARIGGNGG